MSNANFPRHLPTDNSKKYQYAHSKKSILMETGFWLGMSFIGLLSWATGMWMSIVFGGAQLITAPIKTALKSIDNLTNHRKTAKSIINLAIATLSLAAGAVLGAVLLSQLPIVATVLTTLHSAMGTSFVTAASMMVGGAIFGRVTNKVSPTTGALLGALFAPFLPMTFPLIVESAVLGALSLAFITTQATKQCLRAYYKLRYGHSNADGYEFNHSKAIEPTPSDQQQATVLHVSAADVRDLRVACLTAIEQLQTTSLSNIERRPLSNTFKDTLHLLNHAKSEDDVKQLKSLLKNVCEAPRESSIEEIILRTQGPTACKDQYQRAHLFAATSREAIFQLKDARTQDNRNLVNEITESKWAFIR